MQQIEVFLTMKHIRKWYYFIRINELEWMDVNDGTNIAFGGDFSWPWCLQFSQIASMIWAELRKGLNWNWNRTSYEVFSKLSGNLQWFQSFTKKLELWITPFLVDILSKTSSTCWNWWSWGYWNVKNVDSMWCMGYYTVFTALVLRSIVVHVWLGSGEAREVNKMVSRVWRKMVLQVCGKW